MDFTLPEEHVAIRDLARQILTEHGSAEHHTSLERDGDWFDRGAWRALAGAGLLGVCVPEDLGGLGLDTLAMHVLLVEHAAAAGHVPLLETCVLGTRALVASSHVRRQELLTGLMAGEVVIVAALTDPDGADVREPTLQAEPDGDGWRLQGTKNLVSCLPLADHVVVTARTPDGQVLVALLAVDACVVESQRTPSDVPHGRLVLGGVPVAAVDVLAMGDAGHAMLGDLVDHGRAALAACQVGLVREAIVLAAAHTSQREQFGRPLATFQAVSQRVADARIAQEMLALTSLQASWMLANDLPAAEELVIAAWWSAEAGHHALHAAHHVHGGIGVDREYPLHRLSGRAKVAEFALGNAEELLQELGARIAAEPSLS